jgi:2-polyprenyl-6-methoxyphenol hydroxylase-like FAD-dependent oxidoreductase
MVSISTPKVHIFSCDFDESFPLLFRVLLMKPSNSRIGIIGAGTSGTYLAGLLARQGFQVDLFERTRQPRAEGCGILVVQPGMIALQKGNPEICDRLVELGQPVTTFEFRNLLGGKINSEFITYQNDELPGMLLHRKVILEVLLEAVPRKCLHCNAELETVTQTEEGVRAYFKDGREWQGDLLVGADGIVSKTREAVVPGVKPFYLGDVVWRGITIDRSFCPEGNFIVYVRGRGIYANFFHLGGDRTHWGFFVEREQGENDRWQLRPQDVTLPREELAKLPGNARDLIASTPANQIVCRYSYDIDPLPKLYQGRVVLIGDAGHAKSSTRARGMTSGWEDALLLTHHLTTAVDIPQALAAFQAERLPVVHEYQRSSREQSLRIGRRQKWVA